MDEKELRSMYRIYQTIGEMLVDRGYSFVQQELKCDFKTFIKNEDNLLTPIIAESKEEKIMVYFSDDEVAGITPLQKLVNDLKEKNITHSLLILKKTLTPFAKRFVNETTDVKIEIFERDDLIVNITKHLYISKHILLSNDQKQDFFSKNKLQESQIPRILSSDPIAKYYGMKRGNLIKIDDIYENKHSISYSIVI